MDPKRIIYSGVGKSEEELRFGLKSWILLFNVESEQELHRLNSVAGDMGVKAPVAFRVNPDVDPKTHAYISMGLSKNKFGVPINEALYLQADEMANVKVKGVSCHIGSQLTLISPFVETLQKIKVLLDAWRKKEFPFNISILVAGWALSMMMKNHPILKSMQKPLRRRWVALR